MGFPDVDGVYEVTVAEDDEAHANEPPLIGWVGQSGGELEGKPAPLVQDCLVLEDVRDECFFFLSAPKPPVSLVASARLPPPVSLVLSLFLVRAT